MSEHENAKVKCLVCGCEFITSTDSERTKCPNCDFEFELEEK